MPFSLWSVICWFHFALPLSGAPQRLPSRSGNLAKLTAMRPGFVAREQIGGRASAGVTLEIYVRERLAVVVLDDEAGGVCLLNVPRRREAASGISDRTAYDNGARGR